METFFWILIVLLVLTGAPFYVALGLGSALIMLFVQNLAPYSIIQMMFNQVASWPLLAMPLFILAGNLMISGGSARSLIKFFDSWAGHFPGGMLVVVVLFCALFSAISGSGYAAIAAVGTLMFPEMKKLGYSDELATGTVAVCGDLGILIPPSILFIVLGMLMQISSAALFAAGMIPGLCLVVIYAIVALIMVRKEKNVLKKPPASWRERWKCTWQAVPSIIMPVIILGGIYSGFFTPTEAATVSCAYAVLIGFVVYRGFTLTNFWDTFIQTAKTNITMYVMIASIGLFSYVISITGLPQSIGRMMADAGLSPSMFLVVFSLVFVALGFFFNPWSLMWIMVPVLMPTFQTLHLNLLLVGVIFCIGTMIGTMTPPMCVGVYFTAKIAKVTPGTVIRGTVPFLIAEFLFMIALIYVPQIVLWLPEATGFGLVGK